MKLKSKKAKKLKKGGEYPDNHNPFCSDFDETIDGEKIESDAEILKGKTKKIKKTKARKSQKLKGRKKRAISDAVTSQIEIDGNSPRSRVATIVIRDDVTDGSMLSTPNTRKNNKAPKKTKKKEKGKKKEKDSVAMETPVNPKGDKHKKHKYSKEKNVRSNEEAGNLQSVAMHTHNKNLLSQSRDVASTLQVRRENSPHSSDPSLTKSAPLVKEAFSGSNRVLQLKQEAGAVRSTTNNYSSLPSSGRQRASDARGLKIAHQPNRYSAGDSYLMKADSQEVPKEPDEREVSTSHPPSSSTNEQPITVVSDQVRRRRTSSIVVSSKERRKKKRLHLAKKWKRLKGDRKLEKAEDANHHRNADETDRGNFSETDRRNFNPIPKLVVEDYNRVDELREKVEEVKEIVAGNVAENLEKRQSALFELAKQTADLEEFAHSFAKVAQETRLKKQSKSKCCGLFSKCRVCWYICACERGVKKKKKMERNATTGVGEERPLYRADANDADSDDDAYVTTDSKASGIYKKHSNRNSQPGSSLNLTKRDESTNNRLSTSSVLAGLRNSRIYMSLSRTSLPSTQNYGTSKLVRSRKTSSSGAVNETGKSSRAPTRTREEIERDVQRFAAQYEDEESRQKVIELLMLDHA